MSLRLECVVKAFKLSYVVHDVGCCSSIHHDAFHFNVVWWSLFLCVIGLEEMILVTLFFLYDLSGAVLSTIFLAQGFLVSIIFAVTTPHFSVTLSCLVTFY